MPTTSVPRVQFPARHIQKRIFLDLGVIANYSVVNSCTARNSLIFVCVSRNMALRIRINSISSNTLMFKYRLQSNRTRIQLNMLPFIQSPYVHIYIYMCVLYYIPRAINHFTAYSCMYHLQSIMDGKFRFNKNYCFPIAKICHYKFEFRNTLTLFIFRFFFRIRET